jgi:prophage maintenance system killer protein
LPILASFAKKILGDFGKASAKRIFNISGHVFLNKRRRTGIELFENLVFLKLNESYL